MSSNPTDHNEATISDFSDRELLGALNDLGGKVSVEAFARFLFGSHDDTGVEAHYQRCCRSRLVWMRRYGLVVRHAEDGEWMISDEGDELRAGRLAKNVETGIVQAKESASLALANVVGERLVEASPVAGRAMQRELAYQINRRRARLRGW